LFFSVFIYAQPNKFIKEINASTGLPSDVVYCVTQDLNGYIWIATDNGVAKYNGESFKIFQMKDGLPSNDIFTVQVDSKNRIWLTGYHKGLYYIENDKVKLVKKSEDKGSIFYKFEKDGIIFTNSMSVNEMFCVVDGVLKEIDDSSLKKKKLLHYFEDEKAFVGYDISMSNGSSVVRLFYKNKVSKIPDDFNYFSGFKINDSYIFLKNSAKVVVNSMNRNLSLDVVELKKSNIFSSNFSKIFRKEVKSINWLGGDFNKKINAFLINDSELIIYTEGRFSHKLTKLANKLPIDLKSIYYLNIDLDGNFWIIDKSQTLKFISKDFEKTQFLDFNFFFKIKGEKIKATSRKDFLIYIITTENSIYTYNLLNKNTNLITKIKSYTPYKILFDDTDDIIIACNQVFLRLNTTTKKTSLITEFYNRNAITDKNDLFFLNNQRIIKINEVDSIIFDRKKELRFNNIAYNNDVFIISNESEIISFNKKSNKIFYSDKIKNTNFLNRLQNYWAVVTNNDGVYFLDDRLIIIQHLNLQENCYSIKEFKDKIVLSTNKGIKIFKRTKDKITLETSYGCNEGLPSERIIDFHFQDNNVLVFTKNGLTKVDLNKQRNTILKAIDIDKIIVNNENINFENNEIIKLKRDQNNISFLMSIFSFDNSKTVKKYYKLSRNNEQVDWVDFNENTIAFKGLDYGKYQLDVKFLNSSDSFNVVYKKINFEIAPKITETLLFKLIFGFLVFGFLTATIIYLKNKAQRKLKFKYKLQNLELKALKAQMNPHFIFNALNTFQKIAFIDGEVKANDYLSKFSKLIRLTLETVNNDEIKISDEIHYLESYVNFERIRTNKECLFEIVINEEITNVNNKIPVMFIQPFIENCFKHAFISEQKTCKIKLVFEAIDKNKIKILIEDNGIGIDNKNPQIQNHNSLGLKLISERLELLKSIHKQEYNFEISNLSEADYSGTRVILILPLTHTY